MELDFQVTGVVLVTIVNCQMADVNVYCSDSGLTVEF
jgi:hypothetical protein